MERGVHVQSFGERKESTDEQAQHAESQYLVMALARGA